MLSIWRPSIRTRTTLRLLSNSTNAHRYKNLNNSIANLSTQYSKLLNECKPLFSIVDKNEEEDELQKKHEELLASAGRQLVEYNKSMNNTLETLYGSLTNISSSNPLPELIKLKVIPKAATVYENMIEQATNAQIEVNPEILEAGLEAAVAYFHRIAIAFNASLRHLEGVDLDPLNNTLIKERIIEKIDGENVEPPKQMLSDLDYVFELMEFTITELGPLLRDFLEGDVENHATIVQMFNDYILAAEESLLLLKWEKPDREVPEDMHKIINGLKVATTPLLMRLARFPLERQMGHLPPVSPWMLIRQYQNLRNFHDKWAQLMGNEEEVDENQQNISYQEKQELSK